MGDGEAERDDRRGRRRRVLLLVAGLVLAVVAFRVALGSIAAGLFTVALREAAARGGLEIVLDADPLLTASGFDARGVTVRTSTGEEVLRAEAASGSLAFFLRRPFLGVSLTLLGARATWTRSGDDASTSLMPAWPAVLTRLEFEDARIDLGKGRRVAIDAVLAADEAGALEWKATRLDYSEESARSAAEKLAGTLRLMRVPATAGDGNARVQATRSPGGGGDARSPATAVTPADATAPTLRFDLAVESGAALVGSLLLDFAAHPLSASGMLAAGEQGRYAASDLAFAFGKLLRASGSAELTSDGSLAAADLSISCDDLMPAFVTLVREPFAGVAPALADAGLEGRGQIELAMSTSSRHSADVTLSLAVTSLRTRSLEAESLVVDLPWMGAALRARTPRVGRLRTAKLSFLGLPWTGIDTAVTASPGALRARASQEWKTVGGTLRVSDMVLEDDAEQGPRLAANLELVDFDLAKLGESVGMTGLSGTMRGDLGRVRVDADAVRTEGSVDVETFGGSVKLTHLHVGQPFSRVPDFGLDAKIDGIDLGALTERFGMGRVSGVLEGHVTGLVVADGQPQSFDADLHTVKRRGVSQTVDVRAIVQLGVLGGGDSGSVTGSLLRVIDRYRYSALGLRCRLRNDVFEIRGVESRGGKDYIVKGSLLPPSVSVVSHSQVVSFSEMLRRIERITTIDEGGSPNAPIQ